jgi:hypothetical protein
MWESFVIMDVRACRHKKNVHQVARAVAPDARVVYVDPNRDAIPPYRSYSNLCGVMLRSCVHLFEMKL